MTDYGRGKAARLRQAVHERLLAHFDAGDLPTSNRFILYELRQLNPGPLYGHKGRAKGRSEDMNVSDACMWLRDRAIVPWGWIADETRSLTEYLYASSVAEFAAESVDRARIDCWDGVPPPLILCESRTFGGVIERTVAREYLCPVAATNGQAGGFLRTEVGPMLQGGREVLYVGDLDFRGAKIEANSRRVLECGVGGLVWERVALTEEQVLEHDLPSVEKYDGVMRTSYSAVEVEALGQGTVLAIVRDELDARLPEPLEEVLVRQADERAKVKHELLG